MSQGYKVIKIPQQMKDLSKNFRCNVPIIENALNCARLKKESVATTDSYDKIPLLRYNLEYLCTRNTYIR